MDTDSPLLAEAFRLLSTDLYRHLDEAEFLAGQTNEWEGDDIDSARKLIPDLVTVIRGVLVEHEAQPSGDCRICTSAWPCPVVTTVHRLVKDPDREFVALVHRANDDG
jgi:hypothetical protein